MADIKFGANVHEGIETLRFPLADGSGYATFNQGGIDSLFEFSQENPVVASYLENVTYDEDDYSVSKIATYTGQSTTYRKDQPIGYFVSFNEAGKIGLVDEERVCYLDSIVGSNEIYNLTPNKTHEWWNIVDDNIKNCGTLKPSGNIRMIKLGDVRNVRDLGGWTCDGGTVKYGLLFRGGTLYSNTSSLQIAITDEEINICKNLLGIKHELDMRVTSETTGQTGSALGEDVEYTNIKIGAITSNYALMVDLEGEYVDEIRTLLTEIFNAVKDNKPLYFHCSYGADRTGVLAFIVNGLLGVSQSDLDKDYELTSFTLNDSGGYESRPRTATMYKGLIEYFNTFNRGTMRDNLVNWCVLLGFTVNELNEFRKNMINGTPEDIVYQEVLLPSDYEEVAYIDHPDTANNIAQTAYCDLGITGRTGLVIKGKTMLYANGDIYLVGSTDGTNRLLCGASSYIGSNNGTTQGGSISYGNYNVESEFEFSTIVGNSYVKTNIPSLSSTINTDVINNTKSFDNGYTMALFCRNNKGTYQRIFNGRLYWLIIEENGEEIMHLLPCRRKSDSVVGLYDTVGKQFFTSANSIPFTAGS